MRTVLIAHNYSEKSFAAMSYHLAHFLAMQGFRVIFISHRPYFKEEKKIYTKKGELIILSWSTYNRPVGIKDIRYFYKIYSKYKPSIIIGHFVGSNISVLVSKLISCFRVKTIVYYHSLTKQNSIDFKKSNIKHYFLIVRKKVFYNLFVDNIICPSNMAYKDILDYFSLNKNKVKTILNPIPDRFIVKEKPESDSIIISYLGRLEKSKNISLLLKSFLSFTENTSNNNIYLQIAGNGYLKEYVKNITSTSNKIRYMGDLDYKEIDNYIGNSHFTIIPSLYDNLPTAGLESLMNGTPILISANTGLSEYCTDEFDSFIFKPNTEQLINLFIKISKIDMQVTYKKMSLNARNTYMNKFSIDNYNNQMVKIINH